MQECSPSAGHYLRSRFSFKSAIVAILIFFLVTESTLAAASQAWGLYHRVRKGDTVSGIAKKYNVSVRSIFSNNRIPSARRLPIGKKLFIPRVAPSQRQDGTWYKVKQGDTLSEIARKHNVSWPSIRSANPKLRSPHLIRPKQKLFIPGPHAIGFRAPLRTRLTVTSNYGYRRHPISKRLRFHHGTDFRAKPRTRVYASKSGRVVRAKWDGGYGRIVVIEHTGGYSTWYGHLSAIRVKTGQRVKRGQFIGLSGSSGHATGPHLHFEIRWKGKSVDSARYIQLS